MARTASSTSLTGKLLFWVTVITAATLIAVVLASTNVARGVIQREIQRRAESAAEDVALEIVSSAEPLELLDSPMWANKLMRRLQLRGDLTGFEIEVVTRGRTGRLSATATDVQREPLIAYDEVPLGQLMARVSEAADSIEVVLRHALSDGELSIRVVASTRVINQFGHVISVNAVWMGIGAWLILVATIAVLINRTIIKPLLGVSAAMGEVAVGRLGEQIEPVGTAEVDPLIGAFNRMTERLRHTEHDRTELLHEVEALNRDLEARVEQATKELARAQADLARRDRLAAMGELVGTIAHEVGTPLNSVLAHLDLLGEDLPPDVDRGRLEIAVREIERVSDVIRRYLETTRAPTPRIGRVPIDLVVDDALRVFAVDAASAGVTLRSDCRAEVFRSDRDLLEQIVRNLVANALAAVERGGTIEVCARVGDDGALALTVRDDGVGMDEETAARAFEPFFSARRDGSGTGLGMSIVRNAVVSLNGRVDLESAPGAGTTVRVCLPAGERPAGEMA
jgi:signal transduction histidine kinase